MSTMNFHELSSYFGQAVQASVDDKVAVYLASMRLAGAAAIVADNDKAQHACHRSDCICALSRPRPWTSSTDSVGVHQVPEEYESGSSYSTSDDLHDCSASRRPANNAWKPNEEHVRFPSRPQTFYSANEQIPAYWLQIMPTPQPSMSEEEQTATEDEVNTPALDAGFPKPVYRSTSRKAIEVLNDIDDPHEIEIHDEIAYMTTAVLTPTENAATPLPQEADGDEVLQKKPSLWRRFSSRVRLAESSQPSLASQAKSSGWRIKMRFIADRLLRRGA
ncbi:hypothetical protein EXIGLDRAFT_843648 [Exidia glandulosa HHB12029]|uniref:Uncharacterized protein n=1 Tax=Exidia glandulosa HHB12029 TaxID=1314781 RepID=A0A165CI48_EXIGL|nr:hypothetical protein EXIGLDRAFT_843648 [Exidia glandulosa HHB12029]